MPASRGWRSQAAEHGLSVWLDLSIDQVAIDAAIRRREDALVRARRMRRAAEPVAARRIDSTSPMPGWSRPKSPRR